MKVKIKNKKLDTYRCLLLKMRNFLLFICRFNITCPTKKMFKKDLLAIIHFDTFFFNVHEIVYTNKVIYSAPLILTGVITDAF